MIIFGSLDPDSPGSAVEMEHDKYWNLFATYKDLCNRARADKDGTEAEMEDWWETLQAENDYCIPNCFNAMADIGHNGPGVMLDQAGKEIEGQDPKQFYDENKFLILASEGPLYVLAENQDVAETIYEKVNATFE